MTDGVEKLPSSLPRPPGELEALERAWRPPTGWRLFSAVNNTQIGVFYIATSLVFLVLAGILSRQADELKEAYAPYVTLDVADEQEGWILMTATARQGSAAAA